MKLQYFLPFLISGLLAYNTSNGQIRSIQSHDKNLQTTSLQKESIQADFIVEDSVVLAGQPVAFTNLSTGNPTFFLWNFQGGTPSISYVESPVIQYSNSGLFDVELVVSGLNGSDTLRKEEYIQVIKEQVELPPGWEYNPSITQHTLVITLDSNPRIFEEPLLPGDFIGVFYEDDNNELKCGGAVEWTGSGNTAVVAQGDNFFTGEKDGFDTGESFNWMLYSWEKETTFPAEASYDPILQLSVFVPDAISVVLDLAAGTVAEVTFPEGWSGISSYVLPWNNNLEDIFASHLDEIEIISDGLGFFQPNGNNNSISNWENRGYIVKMKSSVVIEFEGYPTAELSVEVVEGWNIIHVPIACEVSVADLLQANIGDVQIVREIAGQKLFWPDYSIETLQVLAPGKAYFLKASAPFTLEFQPCDQNLEP